MMIGMIAEIRVKMITLSKSGYVLRQDEASESFLTLVTMPDGKIVKVLGIPLLKQNVSRIILETRRK